MTKIHSLTIVNQQGSHCYSVGGIYNGLELFEIKDKTLEYPDSFHSIFFGFTESGDKVFETYNAPTDVEYVGV